MLSSLERRYYQDGRTASPPCSQLWKLFLHEASYHPDCDWPDEAAICAVGSTVEKVAVYEFQQPRSGDGMFWLLPSERLVNGVPEPSLPVGQDNASGSSLLLPPRLLFPSANSRSVHVLDRCSFRPSYSSGGKGFPSEQRGSSITIR